MMADMLNAESTRPWQVWGYFAGVLLVAVVALGVILAVPAFLF